MPLSYFETTLKTILNDYSKLKKTSNQLTTGRFLCFCSIIIFGAMSYDTKSLPLLLITALALILFINLVKKHRQIKKHMTFTESYAAIIKQYIARFSNDWHNANDTGSEFSKLNEALSHDLDLFGNKSLYQYLCCANTTGGRQRLAALISHTAAPQAKKIELQQSAIKELRSHPEFCFKLQTLGNLYSTLHKTTKEKQPNPAFNSSFLPKHLPAWQKYLIWTGTIITPLSLILLVLNIIPPLLPVCLLFGQFAIAGIFFKHNQLIFSNLHSFYREAALYRSLIYEIEQFPANSELLNTLRTNLLEPQPASQKIAKLSKISECINMRYNFIFYLFGNALFLWDFHCRLAIADWQTANGSKILGWLDTIADLEMLISLNTLCLCKQQTAFPKIINTGVPTLSGNKLFHPLLPEAAAVPNDIPLNIKTAIITGSNMSGKTTFLRTIGINAILAYAGAPICGSDMQLAPMQIFTSMRISDDISQGISSFYAEILRIKTMVEYSDKHLPMLSLIDEIFKGTNSADRIVGAIAAINRLTKPWSILLVSTHDRELCHLSDEQPSAISNYHFCEYFTNDKISFDYQIKSGSSQTTNAKYLLKMAGIS